MFSIKTICVFGDSLVYGMGDSQEGGWVSRLQKKLGDNFKLWNYGIPGDNSFDLVERFDRDCEKKNPSIIIFMIGVNDSQYIKKEEETLVNLEYFRNNLEILTKKAKKYTDKIIFVGLPNVDESVTTNWNFAGYFCNMNLIKYDNEIKKICEKNDLNYIHIFGLLKVDYDLSDGAHPNSCGYQKITDAVLKHIPLD